MTVSKHKDFTTAYTLKNKFSSFTCCLTQEDKDPQFDATMTKKKTLV